MVRSGETSHRLLLRQANRLVSDRLSLPSRKLPNPVFDRVGTQRSWFRRKEFSNLKLACVSINLPFLAKSDYKSCGHLLYSLSLRKFCKVSFGDFYAVSNLIGVSVCLWNVLSIKSGSGTSLAVLMLSLFRRLISLWKSISATLFWGGRSSRTDTGGESRTLGSSLSAYCTNSDGRSTFDSSVCWL